MLALLQFFVLGWFAVAVSGNNNDFFASVEGGVQHRSGDEIGLPITRHDDQHDDLLSEEDLGEEGLDDETNDEEMDDDQERVRRLSTYRCYQVCSRRRRWWNCYWHSCSCTNKPSHSSYTGTGPDNSNTCPWRCNWGYNQIGSSCRATTTTRTTTTRTRTTTTRTTTTTTITSTTTTTTRTTTTRTTTTTTNTTTTTTTTTMTIPILCNEHEMQCPVPSSHRSQVYSVLGNESDEACQGGGDDFPPYVRFPVGQCNTSRKVDDAKKVVVRTVTLRPKLTTGSISFQRFPTAVCSCTFPLAGRGEGVKTDSDWIDRKGDIGDFQPQLRIFRDQSFQDQVVPPESFGVEAKYMYIEVASNASDDVIELVNCSCSPSQDAQHPFAVQMLASRCPTQAPLPLEWLASPAYTVRFSLPFFHFVDFPSVHISCQVQRCAAPETCGICGSSGRQQRLLSEEQGPASVPMAESVTIQGGAISPPLSRSREPVPPVPVQPTLAPQQRQLTVAPEPKLASQSLNVPSLGETLPRSLPSESQRRVLWKSVDAEPVAGAEEPEHHLRIYTPPADLSSLGGEALARAVEDILGRELGLGVGRRLEDVAQRRLRTKSVVIFSGPSAEGGPASWTILEVSLVVVGLSATAQQDLAERLSLALAQSEGLPLELQTALDPLGVQVAVVTADFAGPESPPQPPPQHPEVGVSDSDIPLSLWIGMGVATTLVCGCVSLLIAWQCSRKRRSRAKKVSPTEERVVQGSPCK